VADNLGCTTRNCYTGWHQYTITGLTKGDNVYMRVKAKNAMGFGPTQATGPSAIVVRKTADQIGVGAASRPISGVGVALTVVPADESTSVLDSTQSLRVTWQAPQSDHGAEVSKYKVEWYRYATVQQEVQTLKTFAAGTDAIIGAFRVSYDGQYTDYLRHDITESDMAKALLGLSTLRDLSVQRTIADNGFEWAVTFANDCPACEAKQMDMHAFLQTDGANAPQTSVTVTAAGVLPVGILSHEVTDLSDGAPYTYTITGLTSGTKYFARVSAYNNRGYNEAKSSLPLQVAPPKQKPAVPTVTTLIPTDASSLTVLWNVPESNGGDLITKYRVEWDPKADFSSSETGGALGLYDRVLPNPATDCVATPCQYIINSLTKGTPYFVRVYAYNTLGYSVTAAPTSPESLAPVTQPQPPSTVSLTAASENALLVSFPQPLDNGGAPITKFKVEWDAMGQDGYVAHSVGDVGIITTAAEAGAALLYSENEVQTITVIAKDAYDLSGSFRVAFKDHATEALACTISADDLKRALEAIPPVGEVRVTRAEHLRLSASTGAMTENGFVWTVEFLTYQGDASVGVAAKRIGDVPELKVSNSQYALGSTFGQSFAGSEVTPTGTNLLGGGSTECSVLTTVEGWAGYEQQSITTAITNGALVGADIGQLGGTFTLTFDGKSTGGLAFDITADDMKKELENLGNTGSLYVTRRIMSDTNGGHQWTIVFKTLLGNVDTIAFDKTGLTSSVPAATIVMSRNDPIVGATPPMSSSLKGEAELDGAAIAGSTVQYTIPNLKRGAYYHVRVSAWNGVGHSYGKTMYSTPAIEAPSGVPLAPV